MIEIPRKTSGRTFHHMNHRYDEAKETELEKGDPIQLLHCRETISGRIHSEAGARAITGVLSALEAEPMGKDKMMSDRQTKVSP
jgi:hypothetical protein